MIGKKINQLATELAPDSTDLTIIGDPISGVSKKITLAQLGAIFSGAVSFYTNLAAFPVTGDINVIYCAKDTQKLYLWSGSAYVEVFPSQALLNTYQLKSEKGVSNGYASLDSAGKVPIAQLPSSIMEYKGTWNASTNTPTLANGTGDTGDVYICNVAGTVNFGAGPLTFAVGDYVIYSGTIWQRSSGAVGTVTSVAASITGDAIGITGSPITTSGTLALAFAGTSAQYINGAGNLTTFPTSLVSGSGASGQVTFFNGANSVTGTNNFFWDATNNRLGIGTTTPQRSIEIYNTTADNHLRLSGNAPSVSMGEAVTGSVYQAKFGLVTTNGQFVSAGVAGDFVIISQTGATIIGTSSTEKMRVNTSGNVSINNTNNTYKLDVTGTGRYTGQLRLESTITDGTNTYTLPSATGTLALTSQLTGGTVTSVGLSSATSGVTIGSTPITTSGTITLAIATASGSQQGLLSSTDWTTFNNKQSALTNPVTGTGTTNYLPKFTGTSTIGNSVIQEASSNIGIGGSPSGTYGKLSVFGGLSIKDDNNAKLEIGRYSSAASNSYIKLGTNSNSLRFTNAGDLADIMELTNSGNLGLGVTPSAWGSNRTALQFGALGAVFSDNNVTSEIGANVYISTAPAYTYITSNYATRFTQINGQFQWQQAPSGTAGNAITFTQAMTLLASGNLGIGTTNPQRILTVYNSNAATLYQTPTSGTGASDGFYVGQTSDVSYVWNYNSFPLVFATANTERMRIWGSTGNVNIGTTPASDSGYKLDVNGTGRFTGALSGTSASFSNSVNGEQSLANNNTNSGTSAISVFNLENNVSVGQLVYSSSTYTGGYTGIGANTYALINRSSTGSFKVITGGFTDAQTRLTIASTGAATFSSSVTAGASITIGTSGSYAAGSIYSDAQWGMIFRAKQASPSIAQFMWANSADSELMRISPSGGLQIGTTPDSGYKLDVAGTSRFSGTLETTSGGSERHIRMLGYNNSYVSLRTNTGFNSSYNAFNVIVNSNITDTGQGNTSIPSWEMVLGGNLPNTDSFYIGRSPAGSFTMATLFKIASTGAATFSSSVTATQFTSQGGRGTSFGYKLPDWQIYNTTSGNALAFSNYTSDLLYITSGGNVGIGTTSPAKTLTVVNTAEQLRIAYDGTVYTDFRNDSAGGLLVNTSGGYIINYIGGTERLRIKTNTINISSIPTSSAGLSSGDLYSSAGVLMIV